MTTEQAADLGRAFHDFLRSEIQAQGLSQYRIARDTGIAQSLIGRLLAGGGLNADNAAVLMDYLGLEVRRKAKARSVSGR
ncbi:MAG: helix-turn-helix domain-containing protein [Pirellulales bacterium]